MPSERYVDLLLMEIRQRYEGVPFRNIKTIYFGGGTPSLLSAKELKQVLSEFKNLGFVFDRDIEVTVEINPETLDLEKFLAYKSIGINRFSVGGQTFSDPALKNLGRKHSSLGTRNVLQMLTDHGANFSADLLFALPNQSLEDLAQDLRELAYFNPPHVSAYCLTVPRNHPLSFHRPEEGKQVEMFQLIERELKNQELFKYEISNFSKKSFESRHNKIYWTDGAYWGIGVSSHSFFPGPMDALGARFWNPKSLGDYEKQVKEIEISGKKLSFDSLPSRLPPKSVEFLLVNEALTDYCHTHLRMTEGLDKNNLSQRFGAKAAVLVESRLKELEQKAWVEFEGSHRRLTKVGFLLSDQVFAHMTFLKTDIGVAPLGVDGLEGGSAGLSPVK